jgi:hypothetical protein
MLDAGTVEFDVAGVPHKARKLPPMTQMKLIKRLAPAYAHFRDFARSSLPEPPAEGDAPPVEVTPEEEAARKARRDETYAAFARALADLRDDDLEFIIRETMSSVERQEPTGWVKIWNRQTNTSMFPDVRLNVIFSIVLAVLQVEFAGFFQ